MGSNNTKTKINNFKNNSPIQNNKKNILYNIKSKYILEKVANNLDKYILLKIINNNKYIQSKLGITIDDYKNYSQIEFDIEIGNKNESKNYFINYDKKDKSYYHIFFNKEEIEAKRNYI